MFDRLRLLAAYLRARHGLKFSSRAALEIHQEKMIRRFMRRTLVRSAYYVPYIGRALNEFPIINKTIMMQAFDSLNTIGVTRDEAFGVAAEAERTRDFRPRLRGVSVGLSTGTSGQRGLFLASDAERMRWAGIILARMLPGRLLDAHRIAFFLRSNNNLYESASKSARIQFKFFDLMTPLDSHLSQLKAYDPTILIAPAQVLRQLALLYSAARLNGCERDLAPRKIISVAEVLFDDDRVMIESVFGQSVDQIYQCTEGFLAYTCPSGRLHLNESFLHIEPEWLDTAKTRFYPIVTDFSRESQPIVRYKLDDVLTIDHHACLCGSHERVISRIEGRADDILVLPRKNGGGPAHLLPDFVARSLAGAGNGIEDFRVVQTGPARLTVQLKAADPRSAQLVAETALKNLMQLQGLEEPAMTFEPLVECDFMSKRRRVVRDKGIAL
jgi:putative adenylate-forming enzyme